MHLPAAHEIQLRSLPADRPVPERAKVAEVARDMMRVEETRGEAIRTRASGLLGSCGVLLTLTVGLGDTALKDAAKRSARACASASRSRRGHRRARHYVA